MEEWETEGRWREEEEAACSFHLSAVEDHMHLPGQEMVTLAPAPARYSSSSVQFERTSSGFAPLTVRVGTVKEDMAEGREVGEEEFDGEEDVEKRRREKMKTHSRRLILRKPS